jgi:uridine nucleosidase
VWKNLSSWEEVLEWVTDLQSLNSTFYAIVSCTGLHFSTPFAQVSPAHAAQIVLDAPVKTTMIPINVSHTAIVTKRIHSRLLSPSVSIDDGPLPPPSTKLRHTLSTLIGFFADAYKSTFGFNGPPLHDALTVAYVSRPELFNTVRNRVDIELNGTHSTGETIVDVWSYKSCDDTWGPNGKNCLVTQAVDVRILSFQRRDGRSYSIYPQVEKFFDFLLDCVARCDMVSPLNSVL